MKGNAVMSDIETTTKKIKIDLTAEQVAAKKDQLVDAVGQLADVEAEKALAMQDFNKALKDARKSQRALLSAIRTGQEEIEVQVFERRDERRHEMHTVRLDTNEVIETRPLTFEERQLTLGEKPGGEGAGVH